MRRYGASGAGCRRPPGGCFGGAEVVGGNGRGAAEVGALDVYRAPAGGVGYAGGERRKRVQRLIRHRATAAARGTRCWGAPSVAGLERVKRPAAKAPCSWGRCAGVHIQPDLGPSCPHRVGQRVERGHALHLENLTWLRVVLRVGTPNRSCTTSMPCARSSGA